MRWLAFIVVVVAAAPGGRTAAQTPGKEFRDCEQCPAMIALPGGAFKMGDDSEQARPDERPVHDVSVRAFAIGKTEVTRAEYAAFAKATARDAPGYCTTDADHDGRWENTATANWIEPGFPVTDAHPVTCVNWADATAYAAWLAATTGQPYRLVTEAEWEYAVRAGSTTQYGWGDDANAMCAHANGPDETARRQFPRWKVGAACDDGQLFAAPVASYAPNRFGVYGLAGNVWEWTQDCYAPYDRTPRDGSAYATDDCARRALRGGSWVYGLQDLRSAQRNGLPRPEQRGGDIGFRVARTV